MQKGSQKKKDDTANKLYHLSTPPLPVPIPLGGGFEFFVLVF